MTKQGVRSAVDNLKTHGDYGLRAVHWDRGDYRLSDLPFPPTTRPAFSSSLREGLVALADEVVGKTLNGRTGVAGNLGLAMLAEDNGLLRLSNGDTLTSRSRVNASVFGSGYDVSLTANKETLGKSLVLGSGVTVDNSGNGFHLLGLDLETGRGSPDAVSGGADDGALGDVTGADEAGIDVCLPRHYEMGVVDGITEMKRHEQKKGERKDVAKVFFS